MSEICRCPRCSYPMLRRLVADIELDHCERCGGNFLDPGEGKALFGEFMSTAFLDADDDTERTDTVAPLCPKDGARMAEFRVAPPAGDDVLIDSCEQCGGIWLDAREGAAIAEAHDAKRQFYEKVTKRGAVRYVAQMLTMLPLQVWNPKRYRPWATYVIAALCVLVFAAQALASQLGVADTDTAFWNYGFIPTQLFTGRGLVGLVAYAFLHGGIAHLLGNVFFLWLFGDNIEHALGRGRYVAFYILCGVVSALVHGVLTDAASVPLIGASGAIAGLMGAYLAIFGKTRLWMVVMLIPVLIPAWVYLSLWLGWQGVSILIGSAQTAWWAHIGGFVFGLGVGLLLRRRMRTRFASVESLSV